MVNNVTILSDFTLPNGNEVFIISEVLFVSEAVVSRLHQVIFRASIFIHIDPLINPFFIHRCIRIRKPHHF